LAFLSQYCKSGNVYLYLYIYIYIYMKRRSLAHPFVSPNRSSLDAANRFSRDGPPRKGGAFSCHSFARLANLANVAKKFDGDSGGRQVEARERESDGCIGEWQSRGEIYSRSCRSIVPSFHRSSHLGGLERLLSAEILLDAGSI